MKCSREYVSIDLLMNSSEIFNLGLIGVLLLAVPAVISGLFPLVEKTITLMSEVLYLNSLKGVIVWVIVIGAILYVSGNALMVQLLRYLS